MGKGEISRYEQFLLFPQCFQKACFPGASKGVIVWKWVNRMVHINAMGKGENPAYVITDNKILDWSKLKLIADDISKCI